MKNVLLSLLILLSCSSTIAAQSDKIRVVDDQSGTKLLVNGKPFMVNGMNWDYFPIGTNYAWYWWNQPEDVIKSALDTDMSMLRNMGVNAIRQHMGVPAKWVKYMYEQYGIYTMIYTSFGRYGVALEDGTWMSNTDYADPRVRKALLKEARQLMLDYNNTPGILLFLLGNENNYGLFWQGAEAENIPVENRKSIKQAVHLYKIFNEAAVEMKKMNPSAPIGLCNGDVLFLDIIAKECKDIDIFGVNCYRGHSFGDLFTQVKKQYGRPVLFTEFGSDAYNAATQSEAQREQAEVLVDNWTEIYLNAAGLGHADNCIGGFTFQFVDGWWKFGQSVNLSVHDTNASWANGGYTFDYVHGENNMNEEWFGICAKGKPDSRGIYELYPRAAYYALQEMHQINPYASGITTASLMSRVSNINVTKSLLSARGDKAALQGESTKLIRLSELRGEFTTFNTGGKNVTTPNNRPEAAKEFPSYKGFDHMESFYVGVASKPAENVEAEVTVNILGNVAENAIDEIFYENRGRARYITDGTGEFIDLGPLERVKLYSASFDWDAKYFKMNTFFRKGHYHWGYQGDFFGLYPEANYGDNMDIYGGEAPFGAEIEGKKLLKGFKVAFGPELWWGANPAVMVKYYGMLGKFELGAMFHYDIAQNTATATSYAIPLPKNKRASLMIGRSFGKLSMTLGGLWSGSTLEGRTFQATTEYNPKATVYMDKVKSTDTFGGKLKLVYGGGRFNFYAQGAIMGLVANGGIDNTMTLTGWSLKDSGSGNQQNVLAGFTYQIGNLQIAPNFLWQKPFVGPMPMGVEAPGRLRNILDDPFAVRSNRETTAGELLLTYDPTPSTLMHNWENDDAEDASFAASLNVIYRHHPTSQDAAIGILANGRSTFAFGGAAPAHDLWESNLRMVSRVNRDLSLLVSAYYGTAQPNGDDDRLIKRAGGTLRMQYKNLRFNTMLKFNDWGPYDYHRDFNLTFPFQGIADLSYSLSTPKWLGGMGTRLGVRGTYRTLDEYSPRYVGSLGNDGSGNYETSTTILGAKRGNEWELRTYLTFSLF